MVLLLNEPQLGKMQEFDRYLEKVVDINLRFAPAALECSEIALTNPTPAEVEIMGSQEKPCRPSPQGLRFLKCAPARGVLFNVLKPRRRRSVGNMRAPKFPVGLHYMGWRFFSLDSSR